MDTYSYIIKFLFQVVIKNLFQSSQPPPGPAGAAFPGGTGFPPPNQMYQQFNQPMYYQNQPGFNMPPPQGHPGDLYIYIYSHM